MSSALSPFAIEFAKTPWWEHLARAYAREYGGHWREWVSLVIAEHVLRTHNLP